MSRITTIILAAILLAIPVLADAQTGFPVTKGQFVRVNSRLGTSPPRTTMGNVAVLTADSVYVRTSDSGHVVGLDLQEITSLEVRTGERSRVGPGLMIGAAVGLGLGMIARPARVEPAKCEIEPGDIAPFDAVLGIFCSIGSGAVEAGADVARVAVPVLGTLVGAGIGALLGSRVRSVRWAPAVGTQVSEGGSVLGLSWTLQTR